MSDEQCEEIYEEEYTGPLPELPESSCEPWATQELLTLVSEVARHGDENWAAVSRAFRILPLDTNLSYERYSPEKCAEQYAELAKLLDNAEMNFESAEKQGEYLTEKMVEIHLQELQYSLQQTHNIFGQLQTFLEQTESGEFDDACETILEAMTESDSDFETMYRTWLSHCNAGKTVLPSAFATGKASATSSDEFGEHPHDFFSMEGGEGDPEAGPSGLSGGTIFSQSEVTRQFLAEQIELEAALASASEQQGTIAETIPTTSTKTEPSVQPFFNPANLLKGGSGGLFSFAAGSSEGAALRSPQKSSTTTTVSSVTLSAPTLSKLLEMPPSVPGKLPPLPTFHIKTEPVESKSPHKTLVQQLESISPLRQMKGAEHSAASSSAASSATAELLPETSLGSSLAPYIKKEIIEPGEYGEESAGKSRSLIKIGGTFYSVPEISTVQLPGCLQLPKAGGNVRELSEESALGERRSVPKQAMSETEKQEDVQSAESISETEDSRKSFVDVEGDTPSGSEQNTKRGLLAASLSSDTDRGIESSEHPKTSANIAKSPVLLKTGSTTSKEGEAVERKRLFTGNSSSENVRKLQEKQASLQKSANTSDSQTCEFSFEEITFPIRKATDESTSSSGISRFGPKTPFKRKRESVELVTSTTVSDISEKSANDSLEEITLPQKMMKMDSIPLSTEAADGKDIPNPEVEKDNDKNKILPSTNKLHVSLFTEDLSGDSELELKDKSPPISEELSSRTKAFDTSPSSRMPSLTLKQKISETHISDSAHGQVHITDLTAFDRNQETSQNAEHISSETPSSSSSVRSSISEDTAAIGSLIRQLQSPSYQASKSIVKFGNTSSFQDSEEVSTSQDAIRQEIPDSESESDTFGSGSAIDTPFSSISSGVVDRDGAIAERTEDSSLAEKPTSNENEETQSFASSRRGRRRKTPTKSNEESPTKNPSVQDQANETSSTEPLSSSKKKMGSNVSQIETESSVPKDVSEPVKRGRPRRNKALEKNPNEKTQDGSTVDEDSSSKKSQHVTIKQEKKETRSSRNSSASAERDIGEDESTTSSQDSEKEFPFRNRKNVPKGNDSQDKRDIEELSEKKISEFFDDGENSSLKNISTGAKSSSPENTSVSESSSAKGKGKGRWSPQSVDPTSQSTLVTPITSDISDDSSDASDTSTSTRRSKLKWVNRDSQQKYKTWKKSISIVWREAANHKYANVFSQKVTNDVAPGYHAVVHRPMDLSTIKKNIESGAIKTTDEFERDMMLMFSNAIMYNNSDHDVYHMAVEMQRDVNKQIKDYLATQLIINNKNKEPPVSSLRSVRHAKAKTSQRASSSKGN